MAKRPTKRGSRAAKSSSPGKHPATGREEPGWIYHLDQARWHCMKLREKAMVMVASEIKAREWTQQKAAEFLGLTQPRVSDLICGKKHKFTLDALIEMLYAMDKPVTLSIDEEREWSVSNYSPGSEKDLEDTIEFYSNAIKLQPADIVALSERANAYSRLGKHDLAIGDYSRCIELEPDNPVYRSCRAMEYAEIREFKAALLDFDKIIANDPEFNVFQNRGIVYFMMGDKEKTLEDYTRAIEMDPQRPGPHWNRASLYEQLGRIEEAIIDYENTLKADPTYSRARSKLDELKNKKNN